MTNKNTTTKATDVFNFIVEFKATHDGNSPTMREIGDACGVSSTSMVNYYLNLLERVGWITMERPLKGTSRMISVRGGQWRLINEANFA